MYIRLGLNKERAHGEPGGITKERKMSTTITISILDVLEEGVVSRIRDIAHGYNYALDVGLDSAENDVRRGLSEASLALGWKTLLVIRAPSNSKANLAFGVQEEFTDWEVKGILPKFFSCVTRVDDELKQYSNPYWVCFAAEWPANARIRLEEGKVIGLIEYLKQPANWYQRLYVVRTGVIQYSDEIPFVFKVIP